MSIHPIFERSHEDLKRRTCMLMVTRSCNLNCTYCYEAFKDGSAMSFDMARSIIEREAALVREDPRLEELEVDFMGGEPLMNFGLIREVVEWLESGGISVPFICFATTNGTLLDEDRKAWFREHRNTVWLGLSYDGSTDMQRMNRGVGLHSVDSAFFHEVWPEQGFKMTISKESLPHLAAGIIEAQRKGYRLSASLAQGIDWSDADADLYLEQLRLLSKTYLQNPDLLPANVLTRSLIGVTAPSFGYQRRFCGSGVHMVCYDVDGRSYGCHMFSPVVLGPENALEASKVDWSCDGVADDPRCRECCLRNYCPTCMGFNYRFRGELSKRDFRWCKMILAEAVASCEFQISVLATRRESLSADEAQHGQCALDAYPVLEELSLSKSRAPFRRADLEEGRPSMT